MCIRDRNRCISKRSKDEVARFASSCHNGSTFNRALQLYVRQAIAQSYAKANAVDLIGNTDRQSYFIVVSLQFSQSQGLAAHSQAYASSTCRNSHNLSLIHIFCNLEDGKTAEASIYDTKANLVLTIQATRKGNVISVETSSTDKTFTVSVAGTDKKITLQGGKGEIVL